MLISKSSTRHTPDTGSKFLLVLHSNN